MGFIFTLLFVLCAYLSPDTVFGSLAEYHVEIIIVVIALVGSMISGDAGGIFQPIQAKALFGLTLAVAFSWIFIGMKEEVMFAILNLLPNAMMYFLVVINFRTKFRLQMLVLVLLATALFNVYMGDKAVREGDYDGPRIVMQHGLNGDFPRIQALSFLGDPNDFGQMLVTLLPCLFLFWRPGKTTFNIAAVLLPASALLYGLFLTRSRGGMLGVLACVIMAARRKIGILPSVIVAGVLFVGLSAAGFTGGRDVSAASGSDRTSAWGAGLEMLKGHPLFGIGYNRFNEYYNITAHNTIVVCAAELGMFGFFFWMLFLYPSVRNANVTNGKVESRKEKRLRKENESLSRYLPHLAMPQLATAQTGAGTGSNAGSAFMKFDGPMALNNTEQISQVETTEVATGITKGFNEELQDPKEIQRMGGLMLVSLAGFMTAGWFLSRAFTMTFFLVGGMTEVIYTMGKNQGIVPPRLDNGKAMRWAITLCIGAIVMMWIFLRIDNLMPK